MSDVGKLSEDDVADVCEHIVIEQTEDFTQWRAGCGLYFYFHDDNTDPFQFCPYCGNPMIGDAE